MALSFANDIRPLFRDAPDVDAMKQFGIVLSSYSDVTAKAHEIHASIANSIMACDKPWPKERVALHERWIDEGMAP